MEERRIVVPVAQVTNPRRGCDRIPKESRLSTPIRGTETNNNIKADMTVIYRLSYPGKELTMPIVDMKETGNRIKSMIRQKGMKISDIQAIFGFNTPQAIYKWMRGDAMPTIDNIVVLADIFGVEISDIIVVYRKSA